MDEIWFLEAVISQLEMEMEMELVKTFLFSDGSYTAIGKSWLKQSA